jgi:hypothetical protein
MVLSWLRGLRLHVLGRGDRPMTRGQRGRILHRPTVEALEDRTLPSTVTWINPGGGDWDTAGNWSTGTTPGAGDDVVLAQPGGVAITHSQNAFDTVHSLTVNDNLTLSAGTVNADTILNSGTVTLDGGASLGANSYTQSGGTTVLNGGTLGAPRPQQSTALSFGGSSFVGVPGAPGLNPTAQITVEAWINPSSLSSSLQGIAGTWDDLTGNNRTYLLWIQNGQVAFYVSHTGFDFPNVVSTTTLQTNQWYHVAGTFDGTSLRLYVNGVQEATQVSPGPISTNTHPFEVGRIDGGGSGAKFFDGQIADVAVWDVSRSQSEVQADLGHQLSGSEAGLAGYWVLAGSNGGTVADSTANGNNGTLSTPALVSAGVTGGTVAVQGGTLTGTGTINADLFNAGVVNLGGAPGMLTVNGNYTQTATGTLAFTAGSQFTQFDVTGAAALDGALNVSLANGFSPLAGQTLDALHFGSVSGAFATTSIPVSDGVSAFALQTTPVGLELVGATVAPTSSVNPLPAVSPPSFTVSWSGQDNPGGSGVASFDIFVSDNGGAFVPFLTGTTQTSAVFNGQPGHTYAFYSVATDFDGNREATPSAAQASTSVPAQVATTTSLTSSVPSVSVFGQPVTFTATVSAGAGGSIPTGTVTLMDGTTPLATEPLVNGQASFTATALSRGGHTITAVYNGDTGFVASPSSGLTQTVQTVAVEPDPNYPGKRVLFVGIGPGIFVEIVRERSGTLIEVEVHETGRHPSHFERHYRAAALDRLVVFEGTGGGLRVARGLRLATLLCRSHSRLISKC